jgi:DNA-binding response OmpR family regulator
LKKYILIADDEAEVARVLERALTQHGYEVQAVEDGHRAMSLCRQRAPDLIITDVFMPRKDGVEVVMELRENFPAVRILLMSGNPTAPIFMRIGRHLGVDRTLVKPFVLMEVVETVREILT